MNTDDFDCKVKILLVDDREENLLSLESIIESPDRELLKAKSGNEALKLNIEHEFDLILSDVQMPEMDGFEMLEILRTNPAKRNIPFIFLTALSKEEQYIKRGYDEGAVDYLFKPLNIDIVRSKVDVFVQLAKQKKKLIAQNIELKKLYDLKNQYMGMLAHDLRNPIGAFSFYCEYLIKEIVKNPTEEEKKLLNAMSESAQQMSQLLNDVLDMAKLDSGTITMKNELVEIAVYVNDIVEVNSVFANKKDITLKQEINLNRETHSIFDLGKIRQVLNNLISNAIKFSKPNTTVIISVTINDDKNDDKIYFSVSDQGQGIPKHELGKLFKSFTTTSVRGTAGEKSTGLGLAICSKIIEAYGSKIKVTSEVGKGTVFSFSIPLVPPKNIEEKSDNKTKIESKLIVVADDIKMNNLVLKKILESEGHKVLIASNGNEVIDNIKKNKVDAVFMDVEMPELNGIETTRYILNDMGYSKLPIIGCTGHEHEDELKKCYDAGMIHCITKPINKEMVQMALLVAFS